MKKVFFLLCCFCSTVVLAMEGESIDLLRASHRYIDFVNRIGGGEVSVQEEAVLLLSPTCKKVFNGNVLIENRERFVADLLSVHENYGGWKHTPLDIIDASANNAIVIRSLIETETLGMNTAIIILRFDANNLISEINEVFAPVGNHL